MKIILCLIGILFASSVSAQQTLSLRVCNAAQVPENILEDAEKQADFVMRSAGIEIQWLACRPETSGPIVDKRDFVLSVANVCLNQGASRIGRDVIAATWLEGPRPQNSLVVYYSAVRRFAEAHGHEDQAHVILGYAIAHEFGHQFMGREHTAAES